MNSTKKIFFTAIILIVILGIIITSISFYLSTKSVQDKVIRQFSGILKTYNYSPDHISIGKIRWAGIINPLSIRVNNIQVQHQNYNLQIEQLKLGTNFASLVQLNPELKRITLRKGVLFKEQQPIVHLDGSVYLKEAAIYYRLQRLACNLKDLAMLHPYFSQLEAMNLPVSIQSSGRYDGDTNIQGTLNVFAQQGAILLEPYYSKAVPISEAQIQATFDSRKINLRQAYLKSKDLEAKATGELKAASIVSALKNSAPIALTLTGQLHEMPVDEIGLYWPVGLAEKARHWVTTNLENGTVPNASLDLKGQLKLGAELSFSVDNISGKIDAQGVDVAYIGDLPKVTQTSGHCTYTKENFVISATGICDDLVVDKAHLNISNLDRGQEHMDINLVVRGNLASSLTLIAQKPLELPQKLGWDHTLLTGHAVTQLALSFPLKTDLPLDQVKVNTQSQISQVETREGILQPLAVSPLSKGQFDLWVTNDELKLKGTGVVVDHPAQLTAHEIFESEDSFLKIIAEDSVTDPYLGKFDLIYKNRGFSVTADLGKVEKTIPELQFIKKKGQPGVLNLKAKLADDKILSVSDLDIKLGEAQVRGQGKIVSSNNVQFELTKINIGNLAARLKVSGSPERLIIEGDIDQLDLDPIIQESSNETSTYPEMNITTKVMIHKLDLRDKIRFDDVKTNLIWNRGKVESLTLDSAKPGQLGFHLAPRKDHRQSFEFFCKNAGDLIDYFSPNSDFEEGNLTFVGDVEYVDNGMQVNGELDLRNLIVVKAPLLAQILSLSSLDGIVRTLSGQGIQFNHTVGRIRWQDGQFELDDIHASGSAIALNLNGIIDKKNNLYNLEGELYPLNNINWFFANIPVIGSILSGGKNRGIFSTGFRFKGTRDYPKITINPLSTITPQGVKELAKESAK